MRLAVGVRDAEHGPLEGRRCLGVTVRIGITLAQREVHGAGGIGQGDRGLSRLGLERALPGIEHKASRRLGLDGVIVGIRLERQVRLAIAIQGDVCHLGIVRREEDVIFGAGHAVFRVTVGECGVRGGLGECHVHALLHGDHGLPAAVGGIRARAPIGGTSLLGRMLARGLVS